MKRQYKFTALSAVLFCLIGLLYGCTRDNEIIIPETSVNPPATDYSVAIGDEVTFTGQNMHLISKVAFDNQVVNITTEPSNRSQTTLIVAVPDNFEVTQHISVVATYNSVHKLTLSDAFEVVVPGVTTDVSSATIGDKITLTGKNMHLITKVNFGDQVVSFDPNPDRSHTSLMVTVPSTFDITKKVQLSVTYTTHTVNVSNDFEVIVPPVIPTVTTVLEGEVGTGATITLAGTNLNIIKKVMVNGQAYEFTATATSLSFKAPEDIIENLVIDNVVLVYDNVLGDNQELSVSGSVTVKPTPTLPYILWENIELGSHGTENAFFDVTNGRTMTPCDVVEHKEWVTFAMDNTSGAPTARLLNPANIGTNLLNSQFCNGTALNLNDYAIWKEPTQTTPFKKVTDDALIAKVTNGEITNIRDDIGDVKASDIKTNTPTIAAGEVYYFYHKEKFGLIWVKQLNIQTDRKLNTIIMNVYYEK